MAGAVANDRHSLNRAPMKLFLLEQRAETADAHMRACARLVERQRALVARLEQNCHCTDGAKALLMRFEDLYELSRIKRDCWCLQLVTLRLKLERLH